MDPLLGLLTAGVGTSLVYLLSSLRLRQRSDAWRQAARAAGLTGVEATGFMGWETRLTGHSGPLRIRMESYQHGKSERGTRIVVEGLRHGQYALTVRPEGFTTAIEKTLGERETTVGDDAFDRAAYLQGAPGLIRALFDADTRRLLRPLLAGEWHVPGRAGLTKLAVRTHVSDSELQVEIRESLFGNVLGVLPDALPLIVDLGKRLARPDDLAAAIAANTRREPLPVVRLANLQLLARDHRAHAATRETLRAALADKDAAVRLQAAISVGPEGREVLLETATQAGMDDDLAAKAIVALGEEFPVPQAIDRLRRSAGSDRTALPRACIGVISRARTPEAIEALARVLVDEREELAVAAAQALAAAPSEAGERALVQSLGRDVAPVRIAAAEALGRIGSPQAVAALRECAGAHTFDGALRRAARQAIAEIQSRVTGASPGQLSLAAGDAGQVSLVGEDQRGRVSLDSAGRGSSPVRPDRLDLERHPADVPADAEPGRTE